MSVLDVFGKRCCSKKVAVADLLNIHHLAMGFPSGGYISKLLNTGKMINTSTLLYCNNNYGKTS